MCSWIKPFSSSSTANNTSTGNVAQQPDETSGKASVEGASTINVPSQEIVTPLPPLTNPLPDMPVLSYATRQSEQSNTTQVTVLPNGLRVASERRFGQFCTVGGKPRRIHL